MARTETATIVTDQGTEQASGTARDVAKQVESAMASEPAGTTARVEISAGALHALLHPRRRGGRR